MNNFVTTLMALLLSLVVKISGQQFGNCDYEENMVTGRQYYVFNNGYPQNYSVGTPSCRWIANSPGPIKITCNPLQLPPSAKCVGDALIIQDGNVTQGHRYCENETVNFVSQSNRLTIVFTGSQTSVGGKFLCILETAPKDGGSGECRCGWKNPSRIVGGEETGINEYPMMAALMDTTKSLVFCGATIINEKQVLTAAHCVVTINVAVVRVLVGEHNLASDSETNATRVFGVDSVRIHTMYNVFTQDNDIALLTIRGTISFNQQVGPVCLPFHHTTDTFAGDPVDILGWGNTETGGPVLKSLQKARLSVITNRSCQRWNIGLTTRQLCTLAHGRDSCQFDSGGPVLWYNPETHRIVEVGLISNGFLCASDEPGINTRIGAYMNWIVTNTPRGIKYCEKE